MPLVSVIMPSYNHERFIAKTMESVLGQSVKDLELIVIDDCSKDRSRDIIQEFAKKDRRVRTIFHEKNMGIAGTVNDGIDAAQGKYVAFMGSDDLWREDKLEKQLEVLKANENLVVWSEGEIIDTNGQPTGELFTQLHPSANGKKSGDVFEELLWYNFILAPSVVLKRGNLGNMRYSRCLKYLSDYQLAVDLAKKYNFYFINENVTKYRVHGASTAVADPKGYYWDSVEVTKYLLTTYGKEMPEKIMDHMQFYARKTLKEQLRLPAINLDNIKKSIVFVLIAHRSKIMRKYARDKN